MSEVTAERIGWGVFAVGLGVYILVLVLEALSQAPPAEWLPHLTFGVLFLLVFLAFRLTSWVEEYRSETSGFGLSDWTFLVVWVIWVVAGLGLIAVGFEMEFWAIRRVSYNSSHTVMIVLPGLSPRS